jgi:hypothetical protein
MVLNHVPQGARFLVIAAASTHPQFLTDRDLDIIHRLPVPELLKNGVGKTKHQNVLDRFLAKVMVDPENLPFMRVAG